MILKAKILSLVIVVTNNYKRVDRSYYKNS